MQKLQQLFGGWWRKVFNIEKIDSPKNGLITVSNLLGYKVVTVGGYYESGPYVTGVLRTMLRRIRPESQVRSVLMLGLGGGGGMGVICAKFPHAQITVVEHDFEMVEIAQKLTFRPMGFAPEIIVEDAQMAIQKFAQLHKKFDVIIIDLFKGGDPPAFVGSSEFVSALKQVMEQDGYLAVNFFKTRAVFGSVYKKYFSGWFRLRYMYNQMMVYRQFGMGREGDPLPEGFVTKQQSRIFLLGMTKLLQSEIVGDSGCLGLRYKLGPFALETYTSDIEPALLNFAGLRLVIWSPVAKMVFETMWVKSLFPKLEGQIGVVPLTGNYWLAWSAHAQRHRNKWLANSRYELRIALVDEFETAYNSSGVLDRSVRWTFMREIKSYFPQNANEVTIRLIRDLETGRDVAGLVTVDYSDIGQSAHLVSFICKEARSTSVGYGLIDDWYKQSGMRAINLLNWGIVWKPGDPVAWRGYSKFKKQFGLYLIKYYPERIRFTLNF